MKLAHPEKTVIASCGDGTYMFNDPTACHFVSQAYNLPMLTIVCNNAIWHSTKAATQQVMPDGWAVSTGNFPLTELAPSPRYEMVVAAHGGYGEMSTITAGCRRSKRRQSRQRRKTPSGAECELRVEKDEGAAGREDELLVL